MNGRQIALHSVGAPTSDTCATTTSPSNCFASAMARVSAASAGGEASYATTMRAKGCAKLMSSSLFARGEGPVNAALAERSYGASRLAGWQSILEDP